MSRIVQLRQICFDVARYKPTSDGWCVRAHILTPRSSTRTRQLKNLSGLLQCGNEDEQLGMKWKWRTENIPFQQCQAWYYARYSGRNAPRNALILIHLRDAARIGQEKKNSIQCSLCALLSHSQRPRRCWCAPRMHIAFRHSFLYFHPSRIYEKDTTIFQLTFQFHECDHTQFVLLHWHTCTHTLTTPVFTSIEMICSYLI